MKTITLLVVIALIGTDSPAAETQWVSARGEWTDSARWSAGVPDSFSCARIHGRSEVRLADAERMTVIGMLRIGTLAGDDARLRICSPLVSRREFILAGEAEGSATEIVVEENGALHGVSSLYLGGSGLKRVSPCRALLTIRGGSFVCRLMTIGWGQGADATLAIEGSRPTAVHLLDWLEMGVVPSAGQHPSTSTLAFTLDERGVTPITIQSRRTGLSLARAVQGNRCRLRIALSAVPPRDDVPLVAANVPAKGTFDSLPEGGEVRAEHAGREYRWKLTYRGGKSGCDVVLTQVSGHANDAIVTKCRAIPPTPTPLWQTLTVGSDTEETNAPLAFEGAEGFGRHTAGGRGGRTLFVENRNDSGPGSFRTAATAKGPRVIEFRVGGTIPLKSPITITEPFLTVNGQTAPDGGVTVTGDGLVVRTHEVILRHFRIRPGDDSDDTDALSFEDARRCIADHLSLGWGTDEVLSITGLSDAITIQWCLIAEGLNRDKHGYASIAGGDRVTWHHNLFAHHISRVPRFAGIARSDFRNNVLYNWGHTAGYGQFERVNYVSNYFKPGPSTTQRPLLFHTGTETVSDASLHLAGNVLEGGDAITRDNWRGVGFDSQVRAEQPFPAPPVRTTSAADAYEEVLTQAGAIPTARDATDKRIFHEVRTGAGQIIQRASDVQP